MKFTCNARELNTACNNVMRAVSTKMTVPTIEGILMECGSDTLSLTGYDFEFGINTTLQARVTEPGAIVINAKVLCNIIKELTAETVTFDISGTSVSIICGAAQRQRRLSSVLKSESVAKDGTTDAVCGGRQRSL